MRLSRKPGEGEGERGPGSNLTVYKNMTVILSFSLASRASQFDYANTNEINRDIHLTNALD